MCETGACNRVVRAMLAIKSTYNPGELSRPFVIPRIDFAPDMTDPDVKRMIMDRAAGAAAAMFPGSTKSAEPTHAPGPPPGEPVDVEPVQDDGARAELSNMLDETPPDETHADTDLELWEQTIRDELAALDPAALKNTFIDDVFDSGYDHETDPDGFIAKWKTGTGRMDAIIGLKKWMMKNKGGE